MAPIYNIISELRADVAKKQRIITCLGFLNVLQMLPDKAEVYNHFTNPTSWIATGYWEMTWQFAVERELVLLLFEQTQINPAFANIIIPHFKLIPGSEKLRQLISFDFGEWCKKRRQISKKETFRIYAAYLKFYEAYAASSAINVAAAAAAPAQIEIFFPTAAAPAGGPLKTRPPPETILAPLFTTLGLKYDKWISYQRGRGLYSELRSSIHGCNELLEIDETNWNRSDLLILQWLKPDVEKEGGINWNNARMKRV